MKTILWTIIFSISINMAKGQIQLIGNVTDKTSGEALDKVAVYIPDLKRGAVTDSLGQFQFLQLPKGRLSIVAKYVGFASQMFTFTLSKDTTIQIILEPTVAELSDVVVTGVSKATQLRESPIAISIVSADELQQTTATNIIDAISRQAGVSQITTGAAVSKPVIRGLGYNRVVVLNDGFRQEGQQWGDEHGVEIDELSIDKVEIIKGPGSLMYGSDAIAGVVNFLQPEHLAEGKIALNAILNYQSNNNLVGASLMNQGNMKGISWLARASTKYAGDYRNKYDGQVFNSGFREWNGNGMIGITKSWGFTKISGSSFNQQIGFNEGERDSSGRFLRTVAQADSVVFVPADDRALRGYHIYLPYQRINHHRLSSQSNILFGHSNLVMNFSWQLNQRREFSDPLAPDEAELIFRMHTFTYDLQYHLPELKGWNTTFGFSGMEQISKNSGHEFLIPDYNIFDYGLFGITGRKFGKLFFEVGLRFDQRTLRAKTLYLNTEGEPTSASDPDASLKFPALKKTFLNGSGSIGLSYTFSPRWLIKFNIAKGFRAPNLAELNANGVHEGAFRYEYGNPDLKPESSYQADIGVGFSTDHVNLELSLFENTVQNFIYIAKLSSVSGGDSIPDSSDPVPAYRFTQGNVLLTGGEFSIDVHPHPLDWLHFENSVAYVYAQHIKPAGNNKYPPFIPPAKIRSELRGEWQQPARNFRHFFAGVQFEYYFEQTHVLRENDTETPTRGYPLLSASLGFDIYARGRTHIVSLLLAAQNILDQAYQSHLSRLKYAAENPATGCRGIWNMGRNFSIKLIFPLEFNVRKS